MITIETPEIPNWLFSQRERTKFQKACDRALRRLRGETPRRPETTFGKGRKKQN